MDLTVDEVASGPCIVCGEESQGSVYWLPLLDSQWDVLRPFIEEQTPVSPHSGVKLVMNMFFFPRISRPFCGPECVGEYYKRVAADNCKTGG